jgi:hypothetical protein
MENDYLGLLPNDVAVKFDVHTFILRFQDNGDAEVIVPAYPSIRPEEIGFPEQVTEHIIQLARDARDTSEFDALGCS